MVSRRRVAGYGRQVRLINSTDRQRLSGAFSFACTRLGQALLGAGTWSRHLETAGTSEYPIRLPSGSPEATSRMPHNRQLVRAGDRPNAASPCQRPPFLLGSPRHPAAVAQLVRAPDCGSGGRWFESTQLYQAEITHEIFLIAAPLSGFDFASGRHRVGSCHTIRTVERWPASDSGAGRPEMPRQLIRRSLVGAPPRFRSEVIRRHAGQPDHGIVADRREAFKAHIAAADGALVVLLKHERTNRAYHSAIGSSRLDWRGRLLTRFALGRCLNL
jgi:hypothetical protein